LYPSIQKRKQKSVNAEFQAKVKYWAFINHLQDYKIYLIVIKMFNLEFLSSLSQPLGDNPWLKDPINKILEHDFISSVIFFGISSI